MFPRLRIMYLRRNSKKDSDKCSKKGHPFSTIGVLRHPRTGNINIAAINFHSEDKHFVKSVGRKAVLTKAFKDPNAIYLPTDTLPDLIGFLPDSVYGRITDKKKAQEILESLIKEAREDNVGSSYFDEGIKKDLKALAIHEHETRMAALQKSLTGCEEAP